MYTKNIRRFMFLSVYLSKVFAMKLEFKANIQIQNTKFVAKKKIF